MKTRIERGKPILVFNKSEKKVKSVVRKTGKLITCDFINKRLERNRNSNFPNAMRKIALISTQQELHKGQTIKGCMCSVTRTNNHDATEQ